MSTRMIRLPARTTSEQRAVIDEAGPVSVATRALLWLGADAGGLVITPAGRREIAALLAVAELAPAVLVALERLYERLGECEADAPGDGRDERPARRLSVAPARLPAPPSAADDDLFGAVGHEFGE